MPFCHKCGAQADEGDKFCKACGAKIRAIKKAKRVRPGFILAVVLGLAVLAGVGELIEICLDGEASLTDSKELHVCQGLTLYLGGKVIQLQGWEAQIERRYREELSDAVTDAISLEKQYLGAESEWQGLDAKYIGDGWWRIELSTTCWRVNENTMLVFPEGEAAVELIEAITLKTYCNSEYGYCVNYPPSWTVDDVGKSGIGIASPDSLALVAIWVAEQSYEDFEQYVAVWTAWMATNSDGFDITDFDRGDTVWRIDYTDFSAGHWWDNKEYMVLHEGLVYHVLNVAIQDTSGMSLLPNAYKSFRFQP